MDMRAVNKSIIEEFRANGGELSGQLAGGTMLLLTTTGAKGGGPRVAPLGFVTDGSADRLVIFASCLGAPKHPDWYHNLVANPEVVVEVGTERFTAKAGTAEGAEHDRLYELFTSQKPGTETHQDKTSRKIPMVLLERVR